MALPDDGRTDLTDLVLVGNYVNSMIPPAFAEAAVCLGLVQNDNFGPESDTIKFVKTGKLIAEQVSIGAVYTPTDANSDLNYTAITVQSRKIVSGSNVPVESLRFGSRLASFARHGEEQGRSIARKYDDDLITLINSITNVATAGSTMDVDTLLTARYNIENALTPPGPLVALLSFKQMHELRKLVANSGAALYASGSQLQLINGTPAQNGFQGNYMGVDMYATAGLTASGADTQGAMWQVMYGFCGGLGGAVETNIRWTGHGVASQVPGLSYEITSHIFYDIEIWHDDACSEIRSDT